MAFTPLTFAFLAALLSTATADLKTVKTILYSRHGIRVPYPPDDRGVEIFTTDPSANWFPNASDWGASGTAHLTDHGKLVVKRMGEYYRTHLVETGFLPEDGSQVTVYADSDPTGRDILTARSFMAGLLPGIVVPVHANKSQVANMFNQGGAPGGGNPACQGPTQRQVEGTIGGNGRAISVANAQMIDAMSSAISCCQPIVCHPTTGVRANRSEPCTLMGMPTTWVGKFYMFFTGPIFQAAGLTEYLQLLYLNNMSLAHAAPGVDEAGLARLVSLHQEGLDVTEDYIATQAFGSDMLAQLLATIEQLATGKTVQGLLSKPTDKLVYYAGHDINIYFLRNFLRLNWLTKSYNMNQAMPGGMLTFDLMTEDDNDNDGSSVQYYLRVSFVSQSYFQQRTAAPLTGAAPQPDSVFVTIPECATGPQGTCPLEDFRALVLNAIRSECVSTVPVGSL